MASSPAAFAAALRFAAGQPLAAPVAIGGTRPPVPVVFHRRALAERGNSWAFLMRTVLLVIGLAIVACHGRHHDSGRTFTVRGHPMYVELHGGGEPLVLLHGGGASLEQFAPQIDFFARNGFAVIAPEQVGHGRTPDREGPFHYHEMAEDTSELLRLLGGERAHLVGWSDGGIVALDLAIHHPEQVRTLAVSGVETEPAGLKAEVRQHMEGSNPEAFSYELRRSYKKLAPDGPAHWPVVYRKLVELWLTEPHFTPTEIASIAAPTLVMLGDQDVVSIDHNLELFRRLPNGQLAVLPGTGHAIPVDDADLFNTLVLRFLRHFP